MIEPPPPSCRRLSRASTSFWLHFSKQGVDGRDKPGHDSGEMIQHDSNPLYLLSRERYHVAGPLPCTTIQRFNFEIGACSSIFTLSPTAHALVSSWA